MARYPRYQSKASLGGLTNIDFDSGKALGPSAAYDTTNSVMAFGTTGGTNYMLDTITAKEVDTGEYMSPDLKPIPMV